MTLENNQPKDLLLDVESIAPQEILQAIQKAEKKSFTLEEEMKIRQAIMYRHREDRYRLEAIRHQLYGDKK